MPSAIIIATVLALFTGTIGIVSLFAPRTIQRFALSYYRRTPLPRQLEPLVDFIKTGLYLWMLRALGVISLFMCAVATWAVVNGLLHPETLP